MSATSAQGGIWEFGSFGENRSVSEFGGVPAALMDSITRTVCVQTVALVYLYNIASALWVI